MTLLGDRWSNGCETRRNPRLPNTGSPGTVCHPISHIPPRNQSFRQFVLKRFSNHFQKDLRALAAKDPSFWVALSLSLGCRSCNRNGLFKSYSCRLAKPRQFECFGVVREYVFG